MNGLLLQDDGFVEGTSLQRSDLPLAFWSESGVAWGIVYQPLGTAMAPQTECGFPFDADTDGRCGKDQGGCHQSRCSAYSCDDASGSCEDIGIFTAYQYVERFASDDVFSQDNFFATCFFRNISLMADVQKAFLDYLGSNE